MCCDAPDKNQVKVVNVLPDKGLITPDAGLEVLRDFKKQIAGPAAESLGIVAVIIGEGKLEQNFSEESIRYLKSFCSCGVYSTHECDQERWVAFLISVHREKSNVSSDKFGGLLKAEKWVRDEDIHQFKEEYELAMQLLRKYDMTE